MTSQSNFNSSGSPEAINSPDYDMIIAIKQGIGHCVYPKLLAAAGEQKLSEGFQFFAHAWAERHQTMARNIMNIGRRFAGERLVVLTGAEHRNILRELLTKSPALELKEFYQVTGGT